MSSAGNGDIVIDTKIVQVSNVAPQANKDQLQSLFNYVGKIEDLKLYPSARDMSSSIQVRICFIKFTDSATVGVAQHMTNTVFIDRALIVTPYLGSRIPDEIKGLEILNMGSGYGGMTEPKLPPSVTSQVDGVPPNQVIQTFDPRLTLHNLPPYPPLPASTDSRRVEEIRRTLVAINIDPELGAQEVVDFFSTAGEVKYFRFCSRDGDPIRYAMVEFTEQESIVGALKLNNRQLGENIIKVHHSTQAIVKPVTQNKSNEAAQKEIEEAVSRVKEAQQSILSTVLPEETVEKEKEKEKKRSKSRSRSRSRHRSTSRRRSRSRSRKRRTRSKSRRRSRSRSRSRDRRKRSRSRDRRRRSRSRDRSRRSRTKSKSRSRSRDRKTRDKDRRDRSKDREKKDKDREKDRDRKDRDKKKKDKKDKEERGKEKEREKEKEKEREGSEDSKEREKERKKKSRSPSKSKKSSRRSRSTSRGRSR